MISWSHSYSVAGGWGSFNNASSLGQELALPCSGGYMLFTMTSRQKGLKWLVVWPWHRLFMLIYTTRESQQNRQLPSESHWYREIMCSREKTFSMLTAWKWHFMKLSVSYSWLCGTRRCCREFHVRLIHLVWGWKQYGVSYFLTHSLRRRKNR